MVNGLGQMICTISLLAEGGPGNEVDSESASTKHGPMILYTVSSCGRVPKEEYAPCPTGRKTIPSDIDFRLRNGAL
jgi:hypothetical protein